MSATVNFEGVSGSAAATHGARRPSGFGYCLGFTPPREVEAKLAVRGRLPGWLQGRLLRNCAALYETEAGWRARHHFDGLAMLYRFDIAGGRVTFRNRFLQSRQYQTAQKGRRWGNEFGAPAPRRIWEWLIDPLPRMSDNTNINLCRVAGRYLAVNESIHQYAIDPMTLKTLGCHRYEDELPVTMAMTAHPLYDHEKEELVNVGINYRRHSRIFVYKLTRGSNRREVIASFKIARPPWIHSFCLTRRYVVLVHHPFFVDPLRFALSRASVVENFTWQPEAGTVFVVIDRESGGIRYHESDAFLLIHAANAYEMGQELVLDLLTYPDPLVLTEILSLPREGHPPAPEVVERPLYSISKLMRFRLRPGEPGARVERPFDAEFEFPAINESKARGRSYRFLYGIGPDRRHPGGYMSRLFKFDVERGYVQVWTKLGTYLNEPVFVGRPGAASEDDGVLLVPTLDGDHGTSALIVLDAARLTEIASAETPVHLPFGFHGQFFP